MSSKYKFHNPNGLYFCTLTIVRWIDLFTRQRYRDIILDNLRFCLTTKGLHISGYVIMSNHIHLIASTAHPLGLSYLIGRFKSYTSKQLLDALTSAPESRRDWMLYLFRNYAVFHKKDQQFQLWTHDSHPVELLSHKMALQKLEYIHLNPVRAGWVRHPEDWLYSSASNYILGEGLLEVDMLPPVLV